MIGFLKNYGIIVVVLLDGVEFLRKSFRVKKEKDFDAIFKKGASVANRKFVIYRLENNETHFRVGLSVSKKIRKCCDKKPNQEKNPACSHSK